MYTMINHTPPNVHIKSTSLHTLLDVYQFCLWIHMLYCLRATVCSQERNVDLWSTSPDVIFEMFGQKYYWKQMCEPETWMRVESQ